jgi:hypothetical protein
MCYDLINSDDFSRLVHTANELKIQLSKTLEKNFTQKWIDGITICRMLVICNRTLFELRKSGKLKYSQFGRKILYKMEDIDSFWEGNYK